MERVKFADLIDLLDLRSLITDLAITHRSNHLDRQNRGCRCCVRFHFHSLELTTGGRLQGSGSYFKGESLRVVLQGVDVFGFKDGSREAVFGYEEHGAADLFGGADLRGESTSQEGEDWGQDRVKDAVHLCFGDDAVERLDESDAEHVGSFEGEFEVVVFGFSFDTSPHGAAALGAVGSGS